jgi:hypothetical protein
MTGTQQFFDGRNLRAAPVYLNIAIESSYTANLAMALPFNC